ncbi:MAG TPA: response regulator [Roseiflexaceae bacterium]|nr:response regulator [Roseiflexaceae bacterium]
MCRTRILVADDETDIRNVLRRLLLSEGFCVCEAGNGIEALAAAEHCDIDLVLIDITMPRMSGTEAVRKLRANPRYATTPIMLMTGHVPAGVTSQLGDIKLFPKPLDLDQVLAAIQQAVRPAGPPLS